jgi:hypothetical protein
MATGIERQNGCCTLDPMPGKISLAQRPANRNGSAINKKPRRSDPKRIGLRASYGGARLVWINALPVLATCAVLSTTEGILIALARWTFRDATLVSAVQPRLP